MASERLPAEAGPSRLIGPSTFTPPATPSSSKSAKRRSWFGFASPSFDSPTKTRKGSKGLEDGLELTEPMSAGRYSLGAETPRNGTVKRADNAAEELTIDGEVEETVRRKKGKRRSIKEDDVGEVVRMADLSTRKASLDTSRRKAYDPGGARADDPPNLFSPRTFGRTASDRDAFSPPSSFQTPPLPSTSEAAPRLSSSSSVSDRPLPPLPPVDDKDLPAVPHGIVVTPSSPRRLTKRRSKPNSSSLGASQDRRSRSTSGSSRESSQTRKVRSVKSFNLGLGIPHGHTEDGPPVPSKAQSVSSPLPSRGSSPTPRIAFAEPHAVDRDGHVTVSEKVEKRGRGKRARSLSGMLSRPPVVESGPNSRPTTPEPDTPEVTVKASGVLGWLGVKKTVKRRASETKLKPMAPRLSAGSREQSPRSHPHELSGATASRESLRSIGSIEGAAIPERPGHAPHTSSVTVVPDGSGRRSIFGKRSSSRGSCGSGGSPRLRPVDSQPIPILTQSAGRSFTAESSRSSLNLARAEPSPGLQSETWPSSPVDIEETLFSPESGSNWGPGMRPWMDGTEGRRSNRSSVSNPLGSLPEQATLTNVQPVETGALPTAKVPAQHGRLRSWSDAPLPGPPAHSANGSSPHLPSGSPASKSVHSSPQPLSRPKLPGRSSSGNSVIIGRMRTVFSKSTSRGRSQTLLRQPSSDMDEFGAVRSRGEWQTGTTMRPTSTASSDAGTHGGIMNPQTALLGLSNAERSIFLNDTPDRSPRTSIAAASISSAATGSTRQSTLIEPPKSRNGRARASTMFSGSSTHFAPPPSPQVFPVAATPPRRRPSVIQRLSSGVLRTGPSSPRNNSLFPLPPRSSGSLSSTFTSPLGPDDTASSATSPRPSAGSLSATMGTTSLKAIAAVEGEETPEQWLARVSSKIGREEIANVLAASGDDFHTSALKLFMSRFDFTHNALDVALRRLLMHMSLPRETQQIDRIIEAFSVRYEDCEPGLFIQKDNTYVLAFSMMMLHTDAFNRHNKNKMTKADYVRNTRMDGVSPLVLEAFFDNITFTPFVFIEDESDLLRSAEPVTASTFTTTTSSQLHSAPKNGRVDVYHMIVRDQLSALRVEIEGEIPAESPFSFIGTRSLLDTEFLHRAFVQARNLIIVPPKRKTSAAGLLGTTPNKSSNMPEHEVVLKVTKVGLLSRRDESGEGTKKSRKWKSWSVILTSSQLLFFKDPVWALTLLEQMNNPGVDQESGQPLLPRMTNFKPDEVFPVKDCVAVYDRSYAQAGGLYPNTFRFAMPSHRQYSLQAADEQEMNEWIGLINYATAFKTSGVRMRGLAMGKDRAVLAGAAAAASHKRDLEAMPTKQGPPKTLGKAVFGEVDDSPAVSDLPPTAPRKAVVMGVEEANDVINEGDRLEEVFDVVKAELAAGRGGAASRPSTSDGVAASQRSARTSTDRAPSRTGAIKIQIKFYEDKARTAKETLAANIRIARNLAILTPFQKATRDRIAGAIPSLAAKIRHTRLEIGKIEMWIEILRRDVVYEQREMARLRHVALQAAAKSLRDPLGVQVVVQDVNANEQPEVPVLALPDDEGEPCDEEGRRGSNASGGSGSGSGSRDGDRLGRSPGELPVVIRRSSDEPIRQSRPQTSRQTSVASYRSSTSADGIRRNSSDLLSVRDAYRPDTPREEEEAGGTGRSTPVLFQLSDGEDGADDERTVLGHGVMSNVSGKAAVNASRQQGAGNKLGHGRAGPTSGKDGAEAQKNGEEAEEWMMTRAARRVSLANIPDLQRLHSIGSRDGSHGRKSASPSRDSA